MLDPDRLLHANAYHMAVAAEPLDQAIDRIAAVAGPVSPGGRWRNDHVILSLIWRSCADKPDPVAQSPQQGQ